MKRAADKQKRQSAFCICSLEERGEYVLYVHSHEIDQEESRHTCDSRAFEAFAKSNQL